MPKPNNAPQGRKSLMDNRVVSILMALACGLSYMFSGYHSLYSSQGFRTSKLFSEFLQPKEGK